eukprot:636245-Pyramimonas_sp.AAC.1
MAARLPPATLAARGGPSRWGGEGEACQATCYLGHLRAAASWGRDNGHCHFLGHACRGVVVPQYRPCA